MYNKIELIKILRESTGKGLLECKRAIEETEGNLDRALKILSTNSDNNRETKEGIDELKQKMKAEIKESKETEKNIKRDKHNVSQRTNRIQNRRNYMKLIIKRDERGILYKKGDFYKFLKSGTYIMPFSSFRGYRNEVYNINEEFLPPKNLTLYIHDPALTNELYIIDVKDNEIVLHMQDDHFTGVLRSGKHAFWKALVDHTFITIDMNKPEIDDTFNKSLLSDQRFASFITRYYIESYENALLFYNGEFLKILKPGNYNFWKGSISVNVQKVDMRQLQLDMTGQEIMTEDKVTLRVNFICHYKIIDPVKAVLQIRSYEEQLYILMQLILREYIGTLKLDELLNKKEEIGTFVIEKLKEKASTWGLEFIYAGVKDIILPGEIKAILNQVIEAEKRAQATIITRREETASTRSLLNTAKLMEDNPTLFKLKELEYIERISDKITSLSLNSGSELLEQLRLLFTSKGK